jgi:NAD(P)-dependent dehydrogenase (short-subunit alcohol dehydrogenase family)
MNSNPFDLAGRTALVTGASSGIGARLASVLAGAGARVVLGARRKAELEALAAGIVARGGAARAVALDVTDEASVIAAYDEAERVFGPVDTIVANAGIAVEGRATDLPVAEFDRLMAVNLRGVFLTVREGAKRLIANGSKEKENGRIVIISSITAKKAFRSSAVYAASKAGASMLGKSLALDWARLGVNVNMILPGYIATDLTSRLFTAPAGKELLESFPRRRLAHESDLDGALLFLCSDAARRVTGAEIVIDDGQSL